MSSEAPDLWHCRAGTVPYAMAREAQRRIEAARQQGAIPDVLLLLEHPPVITKGRRARLEHLPMGEDWYLMQGIEVCETDRGGEATYHGPGQLVGYPIVSLRPYGDDVPGYVERLERTMIESLAAHGVEARMIQGLTGVWVGGTDPGERRKIGSIGIHVSRGVTSHGFAVNVNNDLQPFDYIVPCGIENCRMSSVCRETGRREDLTAFTATVTERFAAICERTPVEVHVTALAELVDGLDELLGAGREANGSQPVRLR